MVLLLQPRFIYCSSKFLWRNIVCLRRFSALLSTRESQAAASQPPAKAACERQGQRSLRLPSPRSNPGRLSIPLEQASPRVPQKAISGSYTWDLVWDQNAFGNRSKGGKRGNKKSLWFDSGKKSTFRDWLQLSHPLNNFLSGAITCREVLQPECLPVGKTGTAIWAARGMSPLTQPKGHLSSGHTLQQLISSQRGSIQLKKGKGFTAPRDFSQSHDQDAGHLQPNIPCPILTPYLQLDLIFTTWIFFLLYLCLGFLLHITQPQNWPHPLQISLY